MKLIKLLPALITEASAAAAEAEKKGLESMSFGRYGKDGKVTHMVKGDKLVPVQGKEKPAAEDPNMKPTGTSAKAAGKTPSNAVTADDVAKTTGDDSDEPVDQEKEDAKMDKEHGLSGAQEEPEHVATPNPYATKIKPFGKQVNHEELRRYIPKSYDPLDFGAEMVSGEEVYACTAMDMDRFLWADENFNGLPDWKKEQEIGDIEAAVVQGKEWRAALPDETQIELVHTQLWWQSFSQTKRPPEQRAHFNAFINNVCSGPPPATLQLDHPLERGMVMDRNTLQEFLKAIHIGEEIETPPSGFTTAPLEARTFGEPGYNQAGVIMRLAPNRNGEVHGLALFGFKPSEDLMNTHEDPEFIKREFNSVIMGYTSEKEVIRPSGPKARVTSVRKVMEQPNPESGKPARCMYIIDMEETGYPVDATVTEGAEMKKPQNPTFDEKMNSRFKQDTPNKHKLKNIVDTIVGELDASL